MLKSKLSHLMRKASFPSFIGGARSGAQLMRQKIWTQYITITSFYCYMLLAITLKNGIPFKNRQNLIKSPCPFIILHIMTEA